MLHIRRLRLNITISHHRKSVVENNARTSADLSGLFDKPEKEDIDKRTLTERRKSLEEKEDIDREKSLRQ